MTDDQFVAWLKRSDTIRLALVEVTARIAGVETLLHLSNRPYTTGAADAPANTAYVPCIAGGISFTESLNPDGQASISYGDIEIGNRGGVRDGWLDYVWANRTVKIYMGDPRWPRADFRCVFDGIVGDMDSRNGDVLSLNLLDKLQRLNNPASDALLGGATANAQRARPICWGECHNVTPLLIDPVTLTSESHYGEIERIIEVRDNGIPVEFTADLAAGTFTLLAQPFGTITCSVQGEKFGGVYRNTVASLVRRLATGYGPAATRFSDADIDEDNFAAFEAAHPQPVGLYAADRINVLAACQQLASSVGAQVVCTTAGKLRLVSLALPAAGAPISITADDIDSKTLTIADRTAVKSACKLAYCKNWTVQSSGLSPGLPAEHAALFAQEWMMTTKTDDTVAGVYKLDAQPVQEETLLLTAADADAEAQRRSDAWKVPRTTYSARCRAHLLLAELGDAATLTHRRFGLVAGKTGVVERIGRDWLSGRITIGVLV